MSRLREMLSVSRQFDLPRLIGGVLLATGVVLMELRKDNDWGEFGLFLLAALPCAFLFVLVLAAARPGTPLERWQVGASLAGIAIGLVALTRLMQWLGSGEPLPGAGATFLVTLLVVAVAGYVAFQFRSPIHTFVAAVTLVICYLAFLDWSGSHLGLSDVRDNLAGIAFVYWGLAFLLRTRAQELGPDHLHYVVLTGGLAGIVAGAIGAGTSSILGGFAYLVGVSASSDWELFLLAVSVLLIVYAGWQGTRAATWLCAFAGVLGLLLFVSVNLNSTSLDGWPVWLTIIGAGIVVGSLFGRQAAGAGLGTEPPADPPS
ncbi:MAG: hypothetical protein WDZ37_04365 [Solirubrobacterales bacterium]